MTDDAENVESFSCTPCKPNVKEEIKMDGRKKLAYPNNTLFLLENTPS